MGREAGEARILSEIGFVHLHVHSSYSLLEGAIQVGALAKLAAGAACDARKGATRNGRAWLGGCDVDC